MAVQPQTPYKEFTANGATTAFPLEFNCSDKEHLIVTIDGDEVSTSSWSLDNDQVTFNSAPENGKLITFQRNTPFARTRNYQAYDNSFRPGPINNDFDWIWWKLQELGVADWILSNRISALKKYVDDRDDELRAYLIEEIRKQGVALDQLDDYYNYLMQRLAQIAVDKGWDASFVTYSGVTQERINDGLESVADMLAIESPKNGMHVFVKGFRAATNFALANPYKGGSDFVYILANASTNNGVTIFNGWTRINYKILTPEMAGAYADYVDETNKGHDDSEAIQKVLALNGVNPTTVEFDSLSKYYVANPVIIPDFTDVVGNGAQLFGNNRKNDCFYTGYYVDGVLTSLVDKPENTYFLTNTKVRGFRYRHFKSSMKLRGMTQGCAIEDVRSYECDQHLWSREHYFCTFRQSYADWCGTGDASTPVDERTAVYDLWTLNGMINIETIQCSSASLAYVFYSLQATDISHLDAESCVTALRLRGEMETPDIHSCYFENCGTVLDVSGSNVRGGSMHNNFINHCDVGIEATGASGWLHELDNTWTGAVGKRSNGAVGAFRLLSKNVNSFKPHDSTFPADNTPSGVVTNKNTGYATANGSSEQLVTVYDSGTGDNLIQAVSYMGSTVPFVYFGKYPKATVLNSIPFCSHVATAVDGSNLFKIRITTSIAYSEFVKGDFALHLNTTDDDRKIFGRFFGLNGVIDFNGFSLFTPTVTIENVSNVIVIVLNGIKNANNTNTYQVRGLVKLS